MPYPAPPSPNGTAPEPMRPATAAELRAKLAAPIFLRLPESDLIVEVGRPSVSDLARAGRIPNDYLGAVMRQLQIPGAPERPDDLSAVVEETSGLIDAVCCAALVNPRMVPELEPLPEGAIHPSELPTADKEWIFAYVCRLPGVRPLERFPGGPAGGVEALEDVPGLGGTTE